ncbi:MAG TPA: ATP-binding protein, partial [Bacteroidales bacterium]|nr:ATP-binding protein [Bacteroidales bacterium]
RTLLLHTWNGINFFDKRSGNCRSYIYDINNPEYTHVQVFYNELVDETGRVWLSTDNKKLIMFTPREDVFKSVNISDELGYDHNGTSFCKDAEGNLWVGTAYGGLFKFDKKMNLLDRFQFKPDDYRNNYFIYSLLSDGDNLWMGFASNGLGSFNIRTGKFEHVLKKEDVGGNIIFRINDMLRDRFGIIWFCSSDGIFYIDTKDSNSKLQNLNSPDDRELRAITGYADDAGNIWFSAPNRGLYCLPQKSRSAKSLILFNENKDDPKSLPTNQISSVCQDTSGNYWIGTDIGLVRFFPSDSSFSLFKHKHSHEYIGAGFLKRDNTGNLWFFSDKGIVRFSPGEDEENTFRIITKNDGMPFTEFYPWEFDIDQDGIIYCGGVRGSGNGFFYFDPKEMQRNRHVPPVILTGFKVRNEEFEMDSSISVARNITLNYHQNYFSFEFAALDYVNPQQNQYRYLLEGYDDDWIYNDNRNFANYTGVPPGEYVFRVKGSNNDGLWNEAGTSIRMIINPPPWKTWWAYLLYVIAFISLIIAWRRYDLKRQRLKQALEIEQVEAEKLKELDKMKSQFFANISHEFRTPLTLILGPMEKFRKKVSDAESLQDLNIIQRNAWRLQTLINQLLSLSKIESGQMKLRAWEEDIVSLSRGYVLSFESLAQQKQVQLLFTSDIDHLLIYLDRDKIEKILYNLLSNALKFTNEKGKVEVILKESGDFISIRVSDNGAGIYGEQLEHIFDRFYQADNAGKQEGTGIGLALAKELTELHHGKIEVESEVGRGTSFTVFLPRGREHLNDEEIVKSPEEMFTPLHFNLREKEELIMDDKDLKRKHHSIDLLKEDSNPVLLIVEDNEDLRNYIGSYFEKDYQLIEAVDGLDGFEKAIDNLPDIIISDVMMPNMDGFELGQKLKSDQRTSHIPLILLTARASTESKMEGLETGADDFITKPFDPQELITRVKNLVDQRKRLAAYYLSNLQQPDLGGLVPVPQSGINQMDKDFLKKASETILENMADADFGVEEFSNKMALSRIHLHRKIKGLLNMAPSDLIRLLRLKQAATLLKEGSGNITQIAFEVGFNNLSYFSRCFREEFGCLPSEYK